MALTERQLLDDRYGTYDACRPFARRSDREELWVFEEADCRHVLADNSYSAQRATLANRVRNAGSEKLAVFFENWLMYSEGSFHDERRAVSQTALSRTTKLVGMPPLSGVAKSIPNVADVVADFAAPFVWYFISHIFSIPARYLAFWQQRVMLVCDFPGLSTLTPAITLRAERALDELREHLAGKPRLPIQTALRLAAPDLTDDIIDDLVVNLVGDGVHPTIAALSSEIWLRAQRPAAPSDTFLFHSEAPFQYAARIATQESMLGDQVVSEGQRVVACIGAANRSPKDGRSRPLTFGYGRHACPGYQIAQRCISAGVTEFQDWKASRTCEIGDPTWVASVGYRAIDHLPLRWSAA